MEPYEFRSDRAKRAWLILSVVAIVGAALLVVLSLIDALVGHHGDGWIMSVVGLVVLLTFFWLRQQYRNAKVRGSES